MALVFNFGWAYQSDDFSNPYAHMQYKVLIIKEKKTCIKIDNYLNYCDIDF